MEVFDLFYKEGNKVKFEKNKNNSRSFEELVLKISNNNEFNVFEYDAAKSFCVNNKIYSDCGKIIMRNLINL